MNSRKLKSIEYDNLFFCLSIIYSSVVSLFVQTVRMFIGSTKSLDTLLVYGIMALITIKVLPQIIRSINVCDLALLFFYAMAFILSAFSRYHDPSITKSVLVDVLTQCIPVYFGAKIVHDSPALNHYLRVSACIAFLRVIANAYIFHRGILFQGYLQYDGYVLSTAMALLFIPLMSEHRIFDILFAGSILLLILVTGARGPFLISAVLIIFGMLMVRPKRKYTVLGYLASLGIVGIVYTYMREILMLIASFVGDSASLRTINRLLNNEFFQDRGRTRIFSCAWEYIQSHFLLGCGVTNDRVIINQSIYDPDGAVGLYPHNFFLEIGMQFGLIFGLVLIGILFWTVIRRFTRCHSIRERMLLIALIFSGFAPLMVSASYLSWAMFYGLIGFCTRSDSFGGQSLNEQIS